MADSYISIRELIDKVLRRELLLPEMQRRYVWPATRVRDLLDSLYRGYPSGTILVWETDEEIETKELSVNPTKKPTTSTRLLLLDGQQRITSLAAILAGQKILVRNKNKSIDILFNLEHPAGAPLEALEVDEKDYPEDIEEIEEEESAERDIQGELSKRAFVVAFSALKGDPKWVSVSDVFLKTDKALLSPLGINSDDDRWDKYSKRLQDLRRIADYQYLMQGIEKSKSYEEVTEIFVRVNSLGIKLRGSDLALAQITSKWKGFIGMMEEFAGEFDEDTEKYIVETGLSVRALVIFATKQSKFKTVGRLTKDQLEKSWEIAKNSLRFAFNFLASNAKIDNLNYLSSPFLILPIAIFSNLKGEKLSSRDETLLLKWFFLAHMRGHYSLGSSEGILDIDLGTLFRTQNLENLIAQLLQHVKRFVVEEADLAGRGIRSPMFSMLYFVLRERGAKDWWSGLKLSDKHAGNAHKIQYHHIFPKSLLRGRNDRKEINEIANLAFIGGKTNRQILNSEPIKYLETIIQEKGEETLSTQLVPLDRSLWQIENYKQFLTERRIDIAGAMNDFMKQFE